MTKKGRSRVNLIVRVVFFCFLLFMRDVARRNDCDNPGTVFICRCMMFCTYTVLFFLRETE